MILTRTPLRLSLAGGGSDDPVYAAEHGGYAITVAIDKYIVIGINDTFTPGYTLKYSETEHVESRSDIRHPILRAALRDYNIPPHVEIASFADIPAGTGLGSSGAFTVGLCNALTTYMGRQTTREQIAFRAADIELNILERPGGEQDHLATAMGGLCELRFFGHKFATASRVGISHNNLNRLQDSLCLFFTGYSRDAVSILSTQTRDGLDEIKALGVQSHSLITSGRISEFGALMNEHWQLKRQRSSEMSNEYIDVCYTDALKNGAIGGKLVGAGGGGFLLFVVNPDKVDKLRTVMTKSGLREVPFRFDDVGTTVIAR